MTNAEALREAYGVCTECKLVNVCVEAECRWYHITKALEIADRLEQAECLAHYLNRMRQTTRSAGYADGYIQAVKDVKGDNNG